VLEAVRGVPRPDVASLESANGNYQEYVRRIQTLYGKALPFLRRSLQDLCAVAQVDTPSSWPDALPFAESLPAELLTAPPDETPAVTALRAQLEQAESQIQSIVRAVEEGNLAQRKREQDKLAAIGREDELKAEVEIAKNIVRWATKSEELDQLAQTLDGAVQQRNARATLVAQLTLQHQQLDASVQQLRADVAVKEQEAGAAQAKLQDTKDKPPALFGKDEWRRKVEELEEDARERREALAERRRVLAETEAQLAAVATRLAGEKAQVTMLDRAVTDAQGRADAARAEIAEIEKALGTHRPARRLSIQQADEYLANVWSARNELRARIEALTNQHRSGQLELERIAAQGRQWTAERERLRGALDQARKASSVAQQEALRQLSARRQQGVAQYIERALAPLEESLSQVDRIFVEPARQVLLQRAGGPAPKAGTMRAHAEGLALALAQLAPRVEPVLAEQAGVLDRIQRDFLDKVADAVKSAWE
jgi:chromosome segregation ATPase